MVRVLVERAAARRGSLLGLASVVPADYWARSARGEPWTAYTHLAHALSADSLLSEFIAGLDGGTSPVELDVEGFAATRERAIEAAAALEPPALFAHAEAARSRVITRLANLGASAPERLVVIGGREDAWGGQAVLSLYAYLEQWSRHDSVHESAIREAIATAPDLSAAVHARRLR